MKTSDDLAAQLASFTTEELANEIKRRKQANRKITNNLTTEARSKGSRAQSEQSIKDNWDLLSDIFGYRLSGMTLVTIASKLNFRGIQTRKGAQWTETQVHRLLKRVNGRLEWILQRHHKGMGWADIETFETYQAGHAEWSKRTPLKDFRLEPSWKD